MKPSNLMFRYSPIGSLFFTSRPLTVARGVVAVNVNSINGMFLSRLISHIFNKVPKANIPEPTLINRDAPTPIVVKMLELGIEASIKHMPIMSAQWGAISHVTGVFRSIMVALSFIPKVVFVAVSVSQVWAWSIWFFSSSIRATLHLTFRGYFKCFHTTIISHSLRIDEAF